MYVIHLICGRKHDMKIKYWMYVILLSNLSRIKYNTFMIRELTYFIYILIEIFFTIFN